MNVLYVTLTATVLLGTYAPDSISAGKLPSAWKKCRIGSPDESECMKEAITVGGKLLRDGLPSLKVLPTDPLEINYLSIHEGAGRPVNVKLDFINAKLHGLSTLVVTEVRSDLSNRVINFDIDVPLLTLEGDYVMDGKFLVLPMKGNGKCKLELGPYKSHIKISFDTLQKNGETYWDMTEFTIDLYDVKAFKVNFQNLFNGDKLLGESTNKVLNDNWEDFLRELKPSLVPTFAEVFRRVSNQIFINAPEKNLFQN